MRRRLVVAVVVGILAVLTTTVAAHAYWSSRVVLSPGVVSTGDLTVSATWDVDGTFGPFYPGTTRQRILTVRTTGSAGTTLGWTLDIAGSGEPAYYAPLRAWEGACGTGAAIPSGIVHPPDAAVSVCVQYTMSASAPSTAQSATFAPTLLVSASQAHP